MTHSATIEAAILTHDLAVELAEAKFRGALDAAEQMHLEDTAEATEEDITEAVAGYNLALDRITEEFHAECDVLSDTLLSVFDAVKYLEFLNN